MNSADELQVLRAVCDEGRARARRIELLQSLHGHLFIEPEHQVVFESISFLWAHGGVSAARLAAHLIHRGFPDVDLREYFPRMTAMSAPQESSESETS